jgi:hypothetical protein
MQLLLDPKNYFYTFGRLAAGDGVAAAAAVAAAASGKFCA